MIPRWANAIPAPAGDWPAQRRGGVSSLPSSTARGRRAAGWSPPACSAAGWPPSSCAGPKRRRRCARSPPRCTIGGDLADFLRRRRRDVVVVVIKQVAAQLGSKQRTPDVGRSNVIREVLGGWREVEALLAAALRGAALLSLHGTRSGGVTAPGRAPTKGVVPKRCIMEADRFLGGSRAPPPGALAQRAFEFNFLTELSHPTAM